MVITFGCTKDKDKNNEDTSPKSSLTATINGNYFFARTIVSGIMGTDYVISTAGGTQILEFRFHADSIKIGPLPISYIHSNFFAMYSPNVYEDMYTSDSGMVNITQYDSIKETIKGTFSFSASRSLKNVKSYITFTNGNFVILE